MADGAVRFTAVLVLVFYRQQVDFGVISTTGTGERGEVAPVNMLVVPMGCQWTKWEFVWSTFDHGQGK